MTEHHVEVQPTTYEMFTAVCSCGWMSGDWSNEEQAIAEGQLHNEGKYQPWQIPPDVELKGWDPSRRPFEGV